MIAAMDLLEGYFSGVLALMWFLGASHLRARLPDRGFMVRRVRLQVCGREGSLLAR